MTKLSPPKLSPPRLSPIVSEFETLEDADSYDRWFRAKVTAALADSRPAVPHDRFMADIARMIAGKPTPREPPR